MIETKTQCDVYIRHENGLCVLTIRVEEEETMTDFSCPMPEKTAVELRDFLLKYYPLDSCEK